MTEGRDPEGSRYSKLGLGLRSNVLQLPLELLRRQFYLPKDFAGQRAGQVSTRMPGNGGSSAVRVTVEHMATLLPDPLKAERKEDLLHRDKIHDGNPSHSATSIC